MIIITFVWLSLHLRGSDNTYYTHSSKWWKMQWERRTLLLGPVRWLNRQRCLQPIHTWGPEFDPLIPHKGEKRKRLSKVVLWPTHMHHGMCAHTDTYVGSSRSLVRKLLLDLPPNPWKNMLLTGHWAVSGQACHRGRGFGVLISFAGLPSLIYNRG